MELMELRDGCMGSFVGWGDHSDGSSDVRAAAGSRAPHTRRMAESHAHEDHRLSHFAEREHN